MVNKPKILLISDDVRFPTGVANVSNDIMRGTLSEFDWVQMGGGKNHPDNGKIVDMDGIRIYGSSGFGNYDSVSEIINRENPDAILLFTDPRFFYTQWRMEHELRQRIPIMFYTIWDNYPPPKYNFPFYESCDGLFCISRQTKDIVEKVLGEQLSQQKVISYVPHGINQEVFRPYSQSEIEDSFEKFIPRRSYDEFEFIVLWSNKNMMRKCPMDAIMAYNVLCTEGSIDIETSCIIMNTNPILDEGTDLPTFIKDNCNPKLNVFFTNNGSFPRSELPKLYNIADVVINNSNAEGFGLASAEAIMCGRPVISTVTGGLQDQMNISSVKLYPDDSGDSFHLVKQQDSIGTSFKHGEWVFPLLPDASNIIGSPVTPYIYQDNVSIETIKQQLMDAYADSRNELRRKGLVGRQYFIDNGFTTQTMCEKITEGIKETMKNFKPKNNLYLERF
jgi:glycosyltransferase involved in cell wall biosynthesis